MIPNPDKYWKNEYIEMWIHEGILYGKYVKNAIIDRTCAVKIFEDREEFCEGIAYPVCADGRGVKYWTKEARDFQNGPENCRLIIAGAAIISDPIIRIIGNFYVKIQKPIVPTRIFSSVEEGVEWLQQFKNS